MVSKVLLELQKERDQFREAHDEACHNYDYELLDYLKGVLCGLNTAIELLEKEE